MAIPADATTATIQGEEMQIMTSAQVDTLLESDPEDKRFHECMLPNGRFIFESENGTLKALYKVFD